MEANEAAVSPKSSPKPGKQGYKKTYGPHEKGPLGDPNDLNTPASTFTSGQYTEKVLDNDTVFYRAYGGTAGEIGQYMTKIKPAGPTQAILDSALNPARGNTAVKMHSFTIPKGTTVFDGIVGPQTNSDGALYGGGTLTLIPWKTLSGLGF